MTKRDWTLLTIAAAEGESLSPVQLQKTLFLLGKMKPREVGDDFYCFEPYNYGPFDAKIYRDVDSLAKEGLVSIESDQWKHYSITAKGALAAQQTAAAADAEALDYLKRAVQWVRSLSFQELVKAIYARFPEYRAKSVFQY